MRTSQIVRKIEEAGYSLGVASTPGANYVPAVRVGDLVYTAGVVPFTEGTKLGWKGIVPREVNLEQAMQAAELCAVNLLRAFHHEIGPLGLIDRIVKVNGFVRCDAEFTDQHIVINGASDFLVDVLGDRGRHARSAIGVSSLPLGAPVEIEAVFYAPKVR